MKICFRLFIFIASISLCQAQWQEFCGGVYGGDVSAIISHEGKLFAGTWGNGMFMSTNKGDNWVHINNGLGNLYINDLVIVNGYLVAGTNDDGIYVSSDDGSTWKEANSGLNEVEIRDLAVTGDTILAGTDADLYCSADYGATWKAIDKGLFNGSIHALGVSGDCFLANTDIGTFLSTDRGANWTQLEFSEIMDTMVYFFESTGSTVFASTQSGLYVSSNNGRNWSLSNGDLSGVLINRFAVDGEDLYCCHNYDIYKSTNKGASWKKLVTVDCFITALAMDESNIYAGVWSEGIIRTAKNGLVSDTANTGLVCYKIARLFIINDKFYASFLKGPDSEGLFFSTDKGYSWKSNAPKLSFETGSFYALTKIDNKLFGGNGDGLYVSDNEGTTWVKSDDGITGFDNFSVNSIVQKGSKIFVGIQSGLYVSLDSGRTWALAKKTGAPIRPYSVVANDEAIYAGTNTGIRVSEDEGLTWTSCLDTVGINKLLADGSKVYAGCKKGLYLCESVDQVWTKLTYGETDTTISDFDVQGNSIVIKTPTGIYYTPDNGLSWSNAGKAIFSRIPRFIEIYEDTVYTSLWWGGIYKAAISGLGKTSVWEPLAGTTALSYPNPAKDAIHIEYMPQNTTPVNVTIYSETGSILINRPYEVPGDNVISIDTKELPAGVYFCSVSQGNSREIYKFTIVK